jgi:hypothetical protein
MDEQEIKDVSLQIFHILAEPMIIKLTLKQTPREEIAEKLEQWTKVLLDGYKEIRRVVEERAGES